MNVSLTDSERQQLRRLQKQRRDEAGYVKVTVVLLLDKGRPAGSIADDLGLDEATVYRYAQGLAAPGAGKVPGPRSARLLGAAALGGAGRPEPGTGPDLVHRRAGRWGVAAALLGRGLFGFGPDAVAAPARVQLQAHHARALRGRPCAPSRLPGRGVASPAGAGPSRAGGGVLRRRGPPHPQHAFHGGSGPARARPGRCPRSAGASG